jgi:hypothetical protein
MRPEDALLDAGGLHHRDRKLRIAGQHVEGDVRPDIQNAAWVTGASGENS